MDPSVLLHPPLKPGRLLVEAKAVEESTFGIRLSEGVRQQVLGGFGIRVELPEPCPILEVGDRVHDRVVQMGCFLSVAR